MKVEVELRPYGAFSAVERRHVQRSEMIFDVAPEPRKCTKESQPEHHTQTKQPVAEPSALTIAEKGRKDEQPGDRIEVGDLRHRPPSETYREPEERAVEKASLYVQQLRIIEQSKRL